MNQPIDTKNKVTVGSVVLDGSGQPQEKLELYNTAIQKVDIPNAKLGDAIYKTSEEDIKKYLTGLIREILKHNRSQSFKLEENGEIGSLIAGLTTGDFQKNALALTGRLLNCEVDLQSELGKFTTIRSGSLFCSHFKLNESEFVLVVKIDHAGFLNEDTLKRVAGLPEKHRAQKCATFQFTDGQLDPTVIITDSSAAITEYWWSTYLSLTALSSPQLNTMKAFSAVERLLTSKVKSKSNSDYWNLRNALVGYFTTRGECSYSDMIHELFSSYEPDSVDISMGSLIKEAQLLPSKKDDGFDTHFTLVPSVINARIKRQIRLAPNVDLRINGQINDFDRMFSTGDDGRKFLKIYSDEGYSAFHREGDDNASA